MRTFSKISSQASSTAQRQPFNTALPSITLASNAARRHAFPQTPSHNSKSTNTTSPDRTIKCATVTMMLAERIIRNDWSVEDEHFFESNNMNVWQTLEFISNQNSRKRYNYEGYSDANNGIRTLTPSWRRDSFVEKNVNPNSDESTSSPNGKFSTVTNCTSELKNNSANNINEGVAGKDRAAANSSPNAKSSKNAKSESQRRRLAKKNIQAVELDTEYALSPSDYSDLIKCTFTLPRISAALERLMGTNVVRLTDRNYMKELRERIEDDYRINLQKRIKARELKEVERERVLIIEGKTDIIPVELEHDPIFLVDKKANLEIAKTRAKLKTNREKNSERLKLQGVKWERERLVHEAQEAQRINILRQRFAEQKNLEEQYMTEDADRGMDLLRIENEDWRPCEKELKEFLERERAKMKERSLRVSTPFTADPKDLQNILRARKAFRKAEKRIRKEIESNRHETLQLKDISDRPSVKKTGTSYENLGLTASSHQNYSESPTLKDLFDTLEMDATVAQKNLSSDNDSDISSGESMDAGSSISLAKQRYAQLLQQELETEVAEGLLISKDQYDHLRYEDDKILQLRNAKDIRELYQLAEEIIIGERVEILPDDEPAGIEDAGEEEESDHNE